MNHYEFSEMFDVIAKDTIKSMWGKETGLPLE